MYIAKMRLKINGVVYEKNSEVSDAMLKGVNVDYLKDVGAIVETVPSEEPKGKNNFNAGYSKWCLFCK